METRDADAPAVRDDPSPSLGLAVQELGDMLGAIQAMAELAKLSAQAHPGTLETLDQLLRATRRAQTLLDRIGEDETRWLRRRRPLRLQPLISNVLDLLRSVAQPAVTFEVHVAEDAPPALVDPLQMQHVLLHLGLRSLRALSGRAGTLGIRLETAGIAQPGATAPRSLLPGNFLLLQIRDNGEREAGVEPSTLTPPAAPGPEDLEMAAWGFIEQTVRVHGGRLKRHRDPAEGTLTSIYLPAHVPSRDSLVPPGMPLGSGEPVLFVDDDAAQCKVAHEILHRLGYRPTVFTDPNAALELFLQDPQPWRVALVDLNMPQMTGIDLATQLLEPRPDLPVYVVTGLQGDWTPEMAQNLGIRGVLMKPLSPVTWCLTLHQALSRQGP